MYLRYAALNFIVFVAIGAAAPHCHAQAQAPTAPSIPVSGEPQELEKVITEEVFIPVFTHDSHGRFDPSLEARDFLVFEDDVIQQVRSARRVPSSVLLLLDTAGEMNPVMSANLTCKIAARLVSNLRAGDRVAAIQFGGRVELIQGWTTESGEVTHALETKHFSGKRSHLIDGLMRAARHLKEAPAGSRHVVLMTDGVESSGDKAGLTEAIKQLLDVQAAVHVISYTGIGRKESQRRAPLVKVTTEKRKNAIDIAHGIMNPTEPSEAERKRRLHVVIDLDIAMRRRRQQYEEATKQSEQWLASLAEETGGRISSPASTEEMIEQGEEVAREIGAQYVVTYTPKRPLASASAGEYRNIKVAARRAGLQVRARRGYVVTSR